MVPDPDLAAAARAALAAVEAGAAVRRGAADLCAPRPGRRVLAIGKAASAMAAAARELGGPAPCLVVTKHGHGVPLAGADVREAGHPVPDGAGLAAAQAVEAFVAGMGSGDELLVLLSGGASALLPAPRPPLGLDDLRRTTGLLLASGADILAVNTVRRHLDRLKGGQLARAAAPATTVTIAVSDVPGDDPAAIGSGPTVPDPTTWADALAAVRTAGVLDRLPAAVRDLLAAGAAGRLADTPKPGGLPGSGPFRIVASARHGVAAAAACLRGRGWRVVEDGGLAGEAAPAGRAAAARLLALPPGSALVLGGETTVTLGPAPGLGGRNQEFALAAAETLAGHAGAQLLALGTDGTDGPTDAAGAWADGATWGSRPGAAAALAGHDAHPWLAAAGRLVHTGPTGTNVGDLVIGLRR
jgi:glycerate 2-kinase